MADPLGTSPLRTCETGSVHTPSAAPPTQLAVLDWFFPGFSMFAGVVQKYLHIDLNLYIPLLLSVGMLMLCWSYTSDYIWEQVEKYFMSVVDIRIDDEIYNILMAWVAAQRFSQGARKFVVNTSLSSRSWYLWRWDDDEDDEGYEGGDHRSKNKKALSYTPSFGKHYFWYRGRLLLFRRTANREQNAFMGVSEREEISISCFGRNPWILKELLLEAREKYLMKDEHKTQIYRGTTKAMSSDATWQRCMSRASRPFSTVILAEKMKKELIDDVSDYLDPATQRWYANRGIPYRRGYLLHGPPGTGKSSLSLALAGYFKMRIYIVSLNSVNATEETLGGLFAELPRRCVVLLEDIDTAGLTHTREESENTKKTSSGGSNEMEPGQITPGNGDTNNARLSLSGLLNILDGVASQEGRILIMTTNHVDKLDKALIRPGRIDMIVEFGLADNYMSMNMFQNIFAYLEGDDGPVTDLTFHTDPEERQAAMDKKAKERAAHDARINELAQAFADKIPSHEFSPAELQGHLMKHKHNPEMAVATVEEFVEKTRSDHKEKELKAAEAKRKAEQEKLAEAKKKTEDEEEKAAKEAKRKETEEIKKKVEEEIQKEFGEQIRKRVEAEMMLKKAAEEEEAKRRTSTDQEKEKAKAITERGDGTNDNKLGGVSELNTATGRINAGSEEEVERTAVVAAAAATTTTTTTTATTTTVVNARPGRDVPGIESGAGEKLFVKPPAGDHDKGSTRPDSGYVTPSSDEL
ncbi:BCS1 N terminal-domain-containing protein [Xylaria sp. CBS 124048]|nr:BCS1 N terminal-domain-containing protein [Xylaria sp. CBS 124048]